MTPATLQLARCSVSTRLEDNYYYNNNVFISYTIMVQLVGIVVELGGVGEKLATQMKNPP